jgi:hypothetical protein
VRKARTLGRAVDVRVGGEREARGGERRRPEQRARVRRERVRAQNSRLHEHGRREERGGREERGAAREPDRQEAWRAFWRGRVRRRARGRRGLGHGVCDGERAWSWPLHGYLTARSRIEDGRERCKRKAAGRGMWAQRRADERGGARRGTCRWKREREALGASAKVR